jgi:hypothetical protein
MRAVFIRFVDDIEFFRDFKNPPIKGNSTAQRIKKQYKYTP